MLSKDSDTACHGKMAAEKQAYMSLPRPGVNGADDEFNNNHSAGHSLVLRNVEGQLVPEFDDSNWMGLSAEGVAVVKRLKFNVDSKDETTQKMEYRISVMIEELAAALPPPTSIEGDCELPRSPLILPGDQVVPSPASTPGDESMSDGASTTFRQQSSSPMLKSVAEWEEELDMELGKLIEGLRISTPSGS